MITSPFGATIGILSNLILGDSKIFYLYFKLMFVWISK